MYERLGVRGGVDVEGGDGGGGGSTARRLRRSRWQWLKGRSGGGSPVHLGGEDHFFETDARHGRSETLERRYTLESRAAFLESRMVCAWASLVLGLASGGGGRGPGAPTPPTRPGESWTLNRLAFSLLPLAGADRRKTIQQELVRGKVWTHDQIQGIVNVNVPVRQVVVKLRHGGLWVHNPVAPSGECIDMMRRLESQHGPVKHIVLGTLGLEHKALAGPFAKNFPKATVWVQPGQWSFPFPIVLQLIGFPLGSKLRTLPPPDSADRPEWFDEIEYEILGPLQFKAVGAFGETAFYHRSTSTLLVTDSIVQVDETPPPIIAEDPRALLYHARDNIGEVVEDSPSNRARGWRRICLFGLIFFPSDIDVRISQLLSDSRRLPESMRNLGDGNVPFGLYPWEWAGDGQKSFDALRGGVFCAPILQSLILNRFPEQTLTWAKKVSRWRFSRIVPSHLSNDVRATPEQFLAAFDFCRLDNSKMSSSAPSAAEMNLVAAFDMERLKDAIPPGFMIPFRKRTPAPLARDLTLLNSASEACTALGLVSEPIVDPLFTPE